MTCYAIEIQTAFSRYKRWLHIGSYVSGVMLIAVVWLTRGQWFWPAMPCVGISFYCMARLYLLSKMNVAKFAGHLSSWHRFSKEDQKKIKEAFPLIKKQNIEDDSPLTRELINRVIEPWQKRVKQFLRFHGELFFVLSYQLIVLLSSPVNQLEDSSRNHFSPWEDDTITWVEVKDDVNLSPSSMDELAGNLLNIKQALEKMPVAPSDQQAIEKMADINKYWEQVQQAIQTMSQNSQMQDISQSSAITLQSSYFLPLQNAANLQNKTWRQSMTHVLNQEIQSLARKGARFEGPGIQSKGGNQSPHTVGQLATGRYHESVEGSLAEKQSATMPRRFEQVPPAYRQAVYEFLNESESQPVE